MRGPSCRLQTHPDLGSFGFDRKLYSVRLTKVEAIGRSERQAYVAAQLTIHTVQPSSVVVLPGTRCFTNCADVILL